MLSGTSKIGNRLNISDEDIRKYNRFNMEWQLQRVVDKLLETEQPFDFILARVLIDILNVIYQVKKIKWWINDRSSLSWIWWQCNKVAEKLKLRTPIRYEYEFCHWGPCSIDDLDFDDLI